MSGSEECITQELGSSELGAQNSLGKWLGYRTRPAYMKGGSEGQMFYK